MTGSLTAQGVRVSTQRNVALQNTPWDLQPFRKGEPETRHYSSVAHSVIRNAPGELKERLVAVFDSSLTKLLLNDSPAIESLMQWLSARFAETATEKAPKNADELRRWAQPFLEGFIAEQEKNQVAAQ